MAMSTVKESFPTTYTFASTTTCSSVSTIPLYRLLLATSYLQVACTLAELALLCLETERKAKLWEALKHEMGWND